MNVDMDSIVISIESTTERASNAIDSLISKLNDLQTALSNVGKSSNNFKKIANNIPKVSSKAPSTNTSNIKDKMESMKPDLKGFDVISKFTSENTKGITTEITKYKNELGDTITVQKKMKDGMEQYYRVTKKTTTDGVSGFKKLKDSVLGVGAKLTAMVVGAKNLAKNFSELVETSAEYTEAVNLFYTEMGDKAQEAEKFVKRFSDALYLDPADVMRYMGSFNSLVSGLGVGADNSYKMSKNLTQLAYDLASYKNLDVESAFDKLQSGIAGQIKGLRQVGVALSQNTLQELANEMGINRRINTLDEASKAQLRYIQIMRSSTNWQGDLGKTMMSTENILRSARQQWTLMVRALGDVAAVIARVVMPYFIALTQIVKEAAVALARFFGLDIDFSDRFKDGGKSASIGLGKIEDGIGGVGSAAKKAKKDINSMLAPFDDLNVVQTKLDNAGSGIGGGATGGASLGDLPLPEYNALAKLTKEWSSEIDKAKEKLKTIIPIVGILAGIIGGVFAINKIAKFIGSIKTIGSLFKGLGGAAAGAGGAASIGFAPALAIVGALMITLGNGIDMGKKMSKTLDGIIEDGKSVKEVFSEWTITDFMRIWLPGGALGVGIATVIKGYKYFTSDVVKSKDVIKEMGDELSETGKTKLKPLVSNFENFTKQIDDFHFANKVIKKSDVESIKGNLSNIKESIIKELDVDKNATLKNLKTLEKTMGYDKAQELYKKTENYYKGQKDIITKNSNEIQKILDTASKKNRKLTDEEVTQIQKLRDGMYETGVKSALEYSDDYYKIMSKLKNNLEDLTTEQASSFVKKAKETKDKTIKEANEQYDTIVAEAYKMKEAKQITEEEYENIVKSADITRRQTIDDANKQYDEIYNTTTTKLGKTGRYIDKETGGIRSNWSIFWEDVGSAVRKGWSKLKEIYKKEIEPRLSKTYWINKFDELKTSIKNHLFNWNLGKLHIKWSLGGGKEATGALKTILKTLNLPTSLPTLDVKWYESGGYPERASLFWANENGIPEMVGRIGNQTAVANNDQITTSITNALITALSGMNFGGQGTTVVNIGNKKVYEGMGEYLDGESERYGTAYVNI